MKSGFTIVFILLSVVNYAQIDSSTYIQSTNTKDNFGTVYFSSLKIFNNGIFIYEHRESSCTLWFDKKGTWEKINDTLTLSYTTKCYNKMNDAKTEMLLVKASYKKVGDQLIFINNTVSRSGFIPFQGLFTFNFKMKKTR